LVQTAITPCNVKMTRTTWCSWNWSKMKLLYLWFDQNFELFCFMGPSWPGSYGSWIYNYLCNQCLSPLMLWVRITIRARCTTLCDKVCQWLATGRWFSPVSSTNKTDRHDITEILWNVALNTIKQTNNISLYNLLTIRYW
jgi:hypothetical protein